MGTNILQWLFKGKEKGHFFGHKIKFPLQYSFIEIPISVFHFWFSSSMMISITSAKFLSSISTFFIFFHWLSDVRWFSSYFGQKEPKWRKLGHQKTKNPVEIVQKKSKKEGLTNGRFNGERKELWQNRQRRWIEHEILNKMHIFSFVQRFNLSAKNPF